MKKGKAFKSVALVSLSAVMVCGVAMAAAGCGSGGGSSSNDPNITVSLFCNDADRATNQAIADAWAAKYNAKHGTHFTATVASIEDKNDYFEDLLKKFQSDNLSDVMYVNPRDVKQYATSKQLIDLTPYIATDEITPAKDNVQQIWSNALSYYGYKTGATDYAMGQTIHFDEATDTFKTEDGTEAGLYGLPKDYSNFSMGFNHQFFTEALKTAYTTTKVDATRTVKGATGSSGSTSASRSYTADTGKSKTQTGLPVISYAVDVTAEQSADHKAHKAGEAANIINIGIPTRYTPFNFYKYNTFDEAVNSGDPMATMVMKLTDENNPGYVVTIPGFPDETFKITDDSVKDPNAPYDTSTGHVVLTWAEYGAMEWALSYYLNTFAWDNGQSGTSGTGGKYLASNKAYRTVYGGEQYEGVSKAAVGSALYLLPWLYSNDADLIDNTLQYCISFNTNAPGNTDADKIKFLRNATANVNITDRANWRAYAGNATNNVERMNLKGEMEEIAIQYGFNSERFLETYGAFLAIGSDWCGNPGDSDQASDSSGWDYFRAGRSIFYGAGTWDAATRNEEDRASFDFGQMPAPVAEKYALYSSIKGANYEMVTYSNYNKADRGTAGVNGAEASALSTGKKVYDEKAINENLLIRQDKWGARMDSVGYAVSCRSTDTGKKGGTPTEKTKAAASLCIALTLDKGAQASLTYGGAQLPNFISQCEDLMNYNNKDYENYANGTFKDMITPEGDAEGNDVWAEYYAIAQQMAKDAKGGSKLTVSAYLADKKIGGNQPVKYNEEFANTVLSTFAGTNKLAFAMKVLNLVAFRYNDFDLNIRMQYGLNSVRDSSMYTKGTAWLVPVDARGDTQHNLCYYNHVALKGNNTNVASNDIVCFNPSKKTQASFMTPLVFAMLQATNAQGKLL